MYFYAGDELGMLPVRLLALLAFVISASQVTTFTRLTRGVHAGTVDFRLLVDLCCFLSIKPGKLFQLFRALGQNLEVQLRNPQLLITLALPTF